MRFSVKYVPTTLFSLKDSNSTNSAAKSLFLPSPYAIKMAILNQAITIGGDLNVLEKEKSTCFEYVRDAEISFYIEEDSCFSVNNSFLKILKMKEDKRNKKQRDEGDKFEAGFQQTVAFREYLYLSNPLEILFDVDSEQQKKYLKKYLHKINYFGKRGCFFQFVEYKDNPNESNVLDFNAEEMKPGVLQEYDDFDGKATFENANIFSAANAKRIKKILILPIRKVNSSKTHSIYKSLTFCGIISLFLY